MSDEYLFERQGNDAEIEQLENVLSVYRIDPVVPKIARVERTKATNGKPVWFRWSYALSFASLLILIAVSIASIRYFYRASEELSAVRPVETPEVDRTFIAPDPSDRAAADDSSSANIVDRAIPTPKAKRQVKLDPRPRQLLAAVKTVDAKAPRLTKEEKYAYDQLMVALWITSSKLKVVQDTINRVDDDKPAFTNEKR